MHIRTLKPLKSRMEKEESKFKSQGTNHSDVMVSGVMVASPNSDVILRNVEVNKLIARKRYAPRKQSLVHSKGSLNSFVKGMQLNLYQNYFIISNSNKRIRRLI